MSYRLSDKAEADLEEIADYIAQRNPRAAVSLVQTLLRRWELLATQPRSGALRPDLGTDIRHIATGNYVTYYRAHGQGVLVLRLFHGHRQIGAEELDT